MSRGSARVWLIEPWLGGSHRAWAEGVATHSRHDVTIIGLPATTWRWRLRAGAAALAARIRERAEADPTDRPDVLLISGMVDAAQLLGLTRRWLPADVRVVVFQHESQVAYPTTSGAVDDEAVLRNVMSWCAADQVVFNSRFHRDLAITATDRWLDRQSDDSLRAALGSTLGDAAVVPIGIELDPAGGQAAHPIPSGPPVIVWPHRWEPDKNPDVFGRALRRLVDAGTNFRLVLAGDDPTVGPSARAEVVERFTDHVVAVGPFDRDHYRALLAASDIVVSCADHEFFGVGVAEAVAAGCLPVLPNGLSYPEVIDSRWHEAVLYERGSFGTALADAVETVAARRRPHEGLARTMDRFAWPTIAAHLDDIVRSCTQTT